MANPLGTRRFYQFGPFRLDCDTRVLLRNEDMVPLQPKAIDTLLVLVENAGRPMEKADLMHAVWPDTFVEENNLAHHISVLRKTLGDGEGGRAYIETIPKRGYRFVGECVGHEEPELREAPPAPVLRPIGPVPSASPGWIVDRVVALAKPPVRTALLVCSLAVLVGSSMLFYRQRSGQAGATDRGQGISSIAVLPFANLSADPANEYLGEGLAEELTSALSKVQGLRVAARTSAFQFKGKTEDLLTIGKRLDVATVLEGSMRRENQRLRIVVRLTRTADGRVLWSQTFEREAAQLLSLQDDMARSVVATLFPGAKAPVISGTKNLRAYELYLKGRYFLNSEDLESLAKAASHLEEAVTEDPKYAPAYVELADCYFRFGISGLLPVSQAMPKAKAAAQRALELDDRLAEAWATKGAIEAAYERKWHDAERDLRYALDLNPAHADVHTSYAIHVLLPMGRFEEAAAQIRRALDLDPLSILAHAALASTYYYSREYDRALEQCRNTLELDAHNWSAHGIRTLAYQQKGLLKEASSALQQWGAVAGSSPMGRADIKALAGRTYALAGNSAGAYSVLRELLESPKNEHARPFLVAVIYAGLGQKEAAFEWLEKAYKDGDVSLLTLKVVPSLDSLRSDRRFEALLKQMGLQD